MSGVTVWRWLAEDAIRPWNPRSWIFRATPTSPRWPARSSISMRAAGRASGSSRRLRRLRRREASIQARHWICPTEPTAAGLRFEHEYERRARRAIWPRVGRSPREDLRRCAPKDGIEPFDALVEQFMSIEPYGSARRVFVVVDKGSAHRGQRSIDRL